MKLWNSIVVTEVAFAVEVVEIIRLVPTVIIKVTLLEVVVTSEESVPQLTANFVFWINPDF